MSTFGLSGYGGTYTQVHPGGCTDPGTNGDDGEAASTWKWRQRRARRGHRKHRLPVGHVHLRRPDCPANLINAAGPYPGVVSVSYGEPESVSGAGDNAVFYATYQQAAAQGISVFGATGDNARRVSRIFRYSNRHPGH